MTVRYRNAGTADAAVLEQIFDTTFSETFGHLYRAEDLGAFLTSSRVSEWEEELEEPAFAFRVAEADGTIVGYVKLGPMKLPFETDRPALLLDQIYVLKAHHGTGIAPALIDWAIEEAVKRGAEELYLTVFIDNHRARRLYDRYGFEPVGRYAFMVGNHEDEDIIMRKRL
jgi:ribosomal protein S18 acetylase RimI-like enzyme